MKKRITIPIEHEIMGVSCRYQVDVLYSVTYQDGPPVVSCEIMQIVPQDDFALDVVSRLEFKNTRDAVQAFLDIYRQEGEFRTKGLQQKIRKYVNEVCRHED